VINGPLQVEIWFEVHPQGMFSDTPTDYDCRLKIAQGASRSVADFPLSDRGRYATTVKGPLPIDAWHANTKSELGVKAMQDGKEYLIKNL
jgi:hypothetical protein